jgi:hypothetical protein
MKTIAILGSKIQAEMVIGVLAANGIEAFMNGSREYAGLVTGTDAGRYEISTSDENAEAALAHMAQLNSQKLSVVTDAAPVLPSVYLKRAFVFGAVAIMFLPIVFNAVSIFNLVKYVRIAQKTPATFAWVLIIVAMNLICAVIGVLVYKGIIFK